VGKGKSIEELAKLVGGKVLGDKSCLVSDVGSIEEAKENEITFVASLKHIKRLKGSLASTIIVPDGAGDAEELKGKNMIVVKEPYMAFARVIEILRPLVRPEAKVSPKAEIHSSATIGSNVCIMPFVVIEADVRISDNAVIYPGVYIGAGSHIGERTVIHANVSIREETRVGDDVIIHSNTTIGSDGFGYVFDNDQYIKIPQRGSVRIEDRCEIGASVTIDRSTIGKTIIGKGTKIDNLVQIAHNVEIGENSIIVAQVGVSGSTTIGKRVQIGGQAGIVGHINLGDDSKIGAKAGVLDDVAEGQVVSGHPAIPHNIWLRVQSITKRLPDMKKNLKKLEARLEHLEKDKKKSE
jgi:UDP-3-O-[3-hydroxymyristoyl] glucosamine N-acyltransferase